MSVLLALAAAVGFGLSDFVAGVLTRTARVLLVTVVAQSTSFTVTWLVLPLAGGSPSPASLVWGAAAGVGSTGGAMFLYHGLARGRMSVVGPLSAVVTAAGSAVAGITLGDRPTVLEIAGMVLACLAVALVSATDDPGHAHDDGAARRSLVDAVLAGCGFVVFFVALHRAGNASGLWPVALAQSTGLLIAFCGAALLVARGKQLRGQRVVAPNAMVVGLLGGGATVAYFFATRTALLSVTAVITSLYPAATVVPAMLLLRERLRPVQAVGLVLAALALVCLAL